MRIAASFPAAPTLQRVLHTAMAAAIAAPGIAWSVPIPQMQIAQVQLAQERQLQSMSLEQLGNVQVTTTSKQPEQVWHTPAAVYVMTSQDIQRSGAASIPELLRLVPGVQVSRSQSGTWAVGIRGFASTFSKNLLVLVDGRSVYTPLFEGVYWDVQDLPLQDIDRIEVIRGLAGAIWGPNAVNGVINIITKKAQDTQGVYASALGGGAVNRFIGVAQGGFSPRSNVQMRLWMKGFNRGPEENPGGNPYDTWHQERGGFRVDWQPNIRDSLTMSGQIYQGETGGQNTIGMYFPPAQTIVQGPQPVSGGDVLVRWNRNLHDESNFYLQASFDRTNRDSLQFHETRNTFDVNFVYHNGSLPRQDLIVGAEMHVSPSNVVQIYPTVNFGPSRQTDYIYGGFIQDRLKIVPDRLSVILGTQVEDNNFSGVGLEPDARILWNPTEHQTVWGSVSRSLRIPGRLDRDLSLTGYVTGSNPPVFLSILGNPHFQPEVAIGWGAGYRRLFTPNFYVDLALFHNQYDNLEGYGNISIEHPTEPYPHELIAVPFGNVIKGVTDGLELAPDWKPFDWLELRGTYSHTHMRLHGKVAGQANYISSYEGTSPNHIATFQSLVSLPHGIEIDPNYRYMSALPYAKIPAYQTADLHLAWKMTKHIQLSLDGRDLLQPSHREFPGDNGNPVRIRRDVYGGIRWIP